MKNTASRSIAVTAGIGLLTALIAPASAQTNAPATPSANEAALKNFGFPYGFSVEKMDLKADPRKDFRRYAAGEDARGRSGSRASGGEYDINRPSNGGFEVVWPQVGCIGTFNSRGEAMSFSDRCTDDLNSRSREIARRER